MIGIGLGVITSQGASCARQSRPASSNSTRRWLSSDSRAATAAPAEPPPTTITSYISSRPGIRSLIQGRAQSRSSSVGLVHVPEHRRRRPVKHAGQRLAPDARREVLAERDVGDLLEIAGLDLGSDL